MLALGLLAGVAGVAAMTLAENAEQALTGRPNSYVPGHTLERLLRLPARPDQERLGLNWAIHWQGIALGAVRAWMAKRGFGCPFGPGCLVGDKAHDADDLRAYLAAQGSAVAIPPMPHRRRPPPFDPAAYRRRNLIERAFNRLKDWRDWRPDTTRPPATSLQASASPR